MEFAQELIDGGKFPILAAFLLGLLTAISPCPLATNITAAAYVSKELNSKWRVFASGLIYALGRVLAYSVLGVLLIFLIRSGRDIYGIQKLISNWGNFLLPIFLIAAGLLILFSNKLKFPTWEGGVNVLSSFGNGLVGAFLMGIVFAMAFCPSSALFYFGMLIPMSAETSRVGYVLPSVFAFATTLPVMLVSWVLAFSVGEIGKLYNSILKFELYFRIFVGLLFIAVGVYYLF